MAWYIVALIGVIVFVCGCVGGVRWRTTGLEFDLRQANEALFQIRCMHYSVFVHTEAGLVKVCATCERGWPGMGWPCPTARAAWGDHNYARPAPPTWVKEVSDVDE